MNKQLLSIARLMIAGIATWLLIGSANAAGLLTPADGTLPPLTIKDHHVEVVIEDGYAITTVDQVFHNPHGRDLEAHYSFPIPEKGAVAEFSLWIDDREVSGEVVEKQTARTIYEQERAAGRDAGLTEKDAYRTFEVFVTPVRSNADTRVRLVYMQPAHVDTGIGRYVYPLEEGGVDEAKLAFWTANETVNGSFSFKLRIRSAYPVEAVRVPAQPGARISQTSDGDWQVLLVSDSSSGAVPVTRPSDDAEPTDTAMTGGVGKSGAPAYRLDQDIVVYWRHKAGLPGSVDLVAYKPTPEGRGTFMLVVTPGGDLRPIKQGRDWVFVLDISGSMQGKYATLSEGVQRALKKLRPEDRFRIVLFNKETQELTSGFVNASPEQVRVFADAVSNITPNGGTNMYRGLKRGLDSLDADRTTGLVLVTDGVANVGEVRQKKFLELVRRKDVRLFTLVMGNSANRPLLEAITRESGGFAISVSNSDDIVGQLLSATGKLTHEALHGVNAHIDGVRVRDLTPERIGSLYRGQQLVLLGHYWGDGEASVTLNGRISGQDKQYRTRFAFPEVATENPEIERLWAFANIEALNQQIADLGEKPDTRQAIVDLATEYGLVTDYTSMLVVSEEAFARHGIGRGNRARVATEHAARAHRAQRAAPSRRVDTQQPMYKGSRPSHGSGSFDGMALLMLLPLLGLAWRSRLPVRAGER